MCCTRVKMHSLSNKKQTLLVLGTINKTLIMHQCYRNLSYTQLKIAQDVQHWLNNRCTTVVQPLLLLRHMLNNIVEKIVRTTLFSHDNRVVKAFLNNTVIMAEQCCSDYFFNNVVQHMTKQQQRLFTVVETRENNIDRISLFVIIIIVAKPC